MSACSNHVEFRLSRGSLGIPQNPLPKLLLLPTSCLVYHKSDTAHLGTQQKRRDSPEEKPKRLPSHGVLYEQCWSPPR